MNDTRSPFCIAIAGPTASGKTAAALALAERWPIEIISVDSALVYRDMDIGTAKPSAAERAAAPHHLIDIIDPADTYSAARFVADAQALIANIHTRGRTPVLVGGVRTRVVGRVSMDMITVDLTPLDAAGVAAGVGSEVVLWGVSPSTGAQLSVDEVARAAGTIAYELLCAVAQRVPFEAP